MRTLPIRPMHGPGEFSSYSSHPFLANPVSPRKERYSLLGLTVCLVVFLLAVSRYDATAYVYRLNEEIDFLSWFWKARWLDTFCFFDFAVVILLIGVLARVLRKGTLELARFDRIMLTLGILVVTSSAI